MTEQTAEFDYYGGPGENEFVQMVWHRPDGCLRVPCSGPLRFAVSLQNETVTVLVTVRTLMDELANGRSFTMKARTMVEALWTAVSAAAGFMDEWRPERFGDVIRIRDMDTEAYVAIAREAFSGRTTEKAMIIMAIETLVVEYARCVAAPVAQYVKG